MNFLGWYGARQVQPEERKKEPVEIRAHGLLNWFTVFHQGLFFSPGGTCPAL